MIYVLLLLLSFGLTYIIKNYAIKNLLMAEVNERSSHTVPIPHGGGVAIAITWFAGLIYLFVMKEIDHSLFFALMMGVLISIVSYLDDLYELSASIRLGVQSLVATLGLYFIGGLQTLDLFFFTISNPFAVNTFAFFMIVWFINLYNFLDGIDGYAGSEAIFIGIAGFLLFGGDHFLILIVAVLGFLVWNWHRAKIFMGDVGSTLLGYNIAIFTIYYANQEANNLWVWIIIFGLFWFDATLTLYRRYKNGEQLSKAHKKHAYQRLTQSGWSHSKVTIYSIFINAILFIIAWVMRDNSSLTFIYFTMSIVFLYTIVRFIDSRKGFI